MRIARLIRTRLERLGFEVRMTRTENNFVNNGRAGAANAWGADAFISIHRNGFDNPAANGFETFTLVRFTPESDRLAQALQRSVVAAGVQSNRGVKRHDFATLAGARMPAVLVEYGFISNVRDNELFDHNIAAYADATVSAIASLYNPASSPALPPPPASVPEKPNVTTLHRVQLGAFGIRANAEARLRQVHLAGFTDAFIQTVQV
jgi:N-acetylmuramoyl-L-alanine amidase